VLDTIESESKKNGKNRSHLVAEAIEFWVGRGRKLENDILRLREDLIEKEKENQSLTEKVGKLEEDIRTRENQLAEANRELRSKKK
jgi:hypothetical protein